MATLAVVECALRLFTRGAIDRLLATRRHGVASDATAVLCVGDSYTFGLYYRPEESYPARLEQILQAMEPACVDGRAHCFVENAGVPAQNLAQIAARLPSQLARLKPRFVVVLGGFNDRWNFAAPAERGALARFLDDLVLVKLARLLRAGGEQRALDAATRIEQFTPGAIAVESEDGVAAIDVKATTTRLGGDEHATAITSRLEAIVAMIRASGATPLLCSYPSPEPVYEPPSRAAAEVARRRDVAFVDLRGAFALELARHRYDELFIPGDRHPTDRGHWRVAALVARELVERGLVAAPPAWREALEEAPDRDFALPLLPEQIWPVQLERDGDGWRLRGPPNARFRVVLAASDAPAQKFGLRELALADDAVFRASIADERLEGRLDGEGRARIVLPPETAKGARFVALAVLHDLLLAASDLNVRGIAGPVPIE